MNREQGVPPLRLFCCIYKSNLLLHTLQKPYLQKHLVAAHISTRIFSKLHYKIHNSKITFTKAHFKTHISKSTFQKSHFQNCIYKNTFTKHIIQNAEANVQKHIYKIIFPKYRYTKCKVPKCRSRLWTFSASAFLLLMTFASMRLLLLFWTFSMRILVVILEV